MKGRKWIAKRHSEQHLLPNINRYGALALKRGTRPKLTLDSDFDPLLYSQIYDKAHFRKPSSGEERMAWRFLERNILDACQGPKAERLKYIAEMRIWLNAVGPEGDDYTFGYWCQLLGVEEGFMRAKFGAFLSEQTVNAEAGIKGDFKILRQIEAVRIEQPHLLALAEPDQYDLYNCLCCGHSGSWEHFLGYTCVRGQEQPVEGLKQAVTQTELEEALGLRRRGFE